VLAGKVVVIMMTEGRGFSNAKAKRDLGWNCAIRRGAWASRKNSRDPD
jgi:hypothetical protein